MYYTKIVYPEFSIFLRISIILVLLILSIGLYYGTIAGINILELYNNIIQQIQILNNPSIIDMIIQLILALSIIVANIAKKGIFAGLVKGLHVYIVVILILSLLNNIYQLIAIGENIDIIRYNVVFITILVVNIVLMIKYPTLSATAKIIDEEKGGVKYMDNEPVVLDKKQYVVLDVMGDVERVKMEYDENMVNIKEVNTLTGKRIILKPISLITSEFKLLYGDKLLLSFSLKLGRINTRKLTYIVVFNDDEIGREEYSVEETKTLINSSYPIIRSVVSRMGIDEEDIGEIQFYDGKGRLIPGNTPIYMIDTDTITLKIYTVEKHLELLKYYKVEDIMKLWEKLMKRLEYLDMVSKALGDEITNNIATGIALMKNWW